MKKRAMSAHACHAASGSLPEGSASIPVTAGPHMLQSSPSLNMDKNAVLGVLDVCWKSVTRDPNLG